jgi:hypothetical protein
MELEIEKFNPTKAQLSLLVEESKALDLTDPFDRDQLGKVKKARLNLRDARIAITKIGKGLREDALKFQKEVIAKEKELVGIIEPEENRLAEIEERADKAVERKKRLELLPHRRERLAAIGDGHSETDDQLLDMDGPTFEGYCNERIAAKNEADRQRIEADKRAIEEEKRRIERENEMREREDKARSEERDRVEREQRERDAREQREKEEAELRNREEQERLEREEHYQAFLKGHGYTVDTAKEFTIARSDIEAKLYKLVGVFKIK